MESGKVPGSTDSFYLSDLSPSDKPWDNHRRTAEQVEHLYSKTDFVKYAERIDSCSRFLNFAFKADDIGTIALKLQDAKFCRVRFCPVCQWRRSLMWRARFFKALPNILKDYPTARFIFLTLTVRNCEVTELRDTLTWMNKSWELLTKKKQFPALGYVKTTEVTKSDDNAAHPHFHLILMVRPSYFTHGYLSQAKWAELWQQSLHIDYAPIVNVKAIKPPKNAKTYEGSTLDAAIIVALCETLKYSVKEDDLVMDASWLQELTSQLHKTRSISLGGVFRQYLSDAEPENLIDTDISSDEPTSENDPRIWFGWREMVQRYAKVINKEDQHLDDAGQ